MSKAVMLNGMPAQPRAIGRRFVSVYYEIMNKSPENLHCFYTADANFCHDNIDPMAAETISVNGKMAIRNVMLNRKNAEFKHTCTRVDTVDTYQTLEDSLIVQLMGQISFNNAEFRPFSQSFILVAETPFKYYVQNDIFRFNEPPLRGGSLCTDTASNRSTVSQSTLSQSNITYDSGDIDNTSFDVVEPIDYEEDDELIEQCVIEMNRETTHVQVEHLEHSIMEIQSMNLKNVLRVPTPPTANEKDQRLDTQPEIEAVSEILKDKCIVTIGNVISPGIEADNSSATEATESAEMAEVASVKVSEAEIDIKFDEKKALQREKKKNNTRKRREKKRLRDLEKANEAASSIDESTPPNDEIELKTTQASDTNESSDEIRPQVSTETQEVEPEQNPWKTNETASKPKTFADLVKKEKSEHGQDKWQDDWKNQTNERRASETFNRSSKLRTSLPQRRSRQDKQISPKETFHTHRSSSNSDLLQVFIGNIPHEADDEEIRAMFERFGHLTRFKMHTNQYRSLQVPRYAFISYDNVQSVRNCLAKCNTFYWPENAKNAQKLNVNGDKSLMPEIKNTRSPPSSIIETSTTKKSVKSIGTDTADLNELKKFQRNFILAAPKDSKDGRDGSSKRTPKTNSNLTDVVSSVKNERSTNVRTGSTRA